MTGGANRKGVFVDQGIGPAGTGGVELRPRSVRETVTDQAPSRSVELVRGLDQVRLPHDLARTAR